MIIYDRLRVIDGDTIEIRLLPSRLLERCRIEGLDTDEISSGSRGRQQLELLRCFCSIYPFCPYIFDRRISGKHGRRIKRDAYGRLLVRVYVWRWWRYVNYAEWMKSTGNVKEGSKWNI